MIGSIYKYYLRVTATALLIALIGGCSGDKDTETLNLELLQAVSEPQADIDDIADLLEDGAEADTKNSSGETALLLASDRGNLELATLMIASGADVNTANKRGITPLFRASAGGHEAIAALLIEKKANVNMVTNDGISPLEAATANGRSKLISLLIKNRAKRPLKTEGKIIFQQSFEVDLPHFGAVIFAPYFDPSRSGQFRFYLLKNGRPIYELENYSGNIWPAEKILAVAFRDVNADGNLDILIVSRHNNGATPESLEQIDFAGIYLFGNDAYSEDYSLTRELESQAKTIRGLLKFMDSKIPEPPPSPSQ